MHFPEFRLGVSGHNMLAIGSVLGEVCPAPPGWRVALAAELLAAGESSFVPASRSLPGSVDMRQPPLN